MQRGQGTLLRRPPLAPGTQNLQKSTDQEQENSCSYAQTKPAICGIAGRRIKAECRDRVDDASNLLLSRHVHRSQ